MKNKKTREILKAFLINPQVKFTYPITTIMNIEKSVIAFIDMEALGEDEFKEYGIAKTDTLLALIDAIPNSEVDIGETDIVIKNDKTTQKFRKSPADLFLEAKTAVLKTIEESFDKTIELELDEKTLADTLKIAKLLSLDTLVLKDNKIITGRAVGDDLEDENVTEIEGNFNGKIKLNVNDIAKLPLMTYHIRVFTNGEHTVSFWESDKVSGVKVVISEKL